MTTSKCFLLGLCILLIQSTCPAFAEENSARTISTTGEAIVYVVPDEVIVTFGVRTIESKLDDSVSANDEASQRLVKAIKSLGIEDKHLGTANMQVELRYDPNNHYSVRGYEVMRMYRVTLKDVSKLDALVSAALKNGANQLEGVELRTTELRQHRDNARAMAAKAAREKAIALAKQLDCGIGSPRTINESSNYWYPSGRYNMAQNAMQAAPGGGEGSETMPLGQIAVRANVSVTFDLQPEQAR